MKRGEVWTVSGGGDYAAKPRPAVIVQNDLYPSLGSITLCGFTTELSEAPITRPLFEPSPANGLKHPCRVMVDKISTVYRERLGEHIGQLSPDEMARVETALLLFLGLEQ